MPKGMTGGVSYRKNSTPSDSAAAEKAGILAGVFE